MSLDFKGRVGIVTGTGAGGAWVESMRWHWWREAPKCW